VAGDEEAVLFPQDPADRGEVTLIRTLLPLRDFAEDRIDPGAAVERVVVVELEFGGVSQAEEMTELPPQKTGGPAERPGHGRALLGSDESGVIHVRDPKILRHGNLGDGDRRQAGSFTFRSRRRESSSGSSPRHARSGRRDPSFRFAPLGVEELDAGGEKFHLASRPIPPAIRSSIDGRAAVGGDERRADGPPLPEILSPHLGDRYRVVGADPRDESREAPALVLEGRRAGKRSSAIRTATSKESPGTRRHASVPAIFSIMNASIWSPT